MFLPSTAMHMRITAPTSSIATATPPATSRYTNCPFGASSVDAEAARIVGVVVVGVLVDRLADRTASSHCVALPTGTPLQTGRLVRESMLHVSFVVHTSPSSHAPYHGSAMQLFCTHFTTMHVYDCRGSTLDGYELHEAAEIDRHCPRAVHWNGARHADAFDGHARPAFRAVYLQ